MAQPPLLRRLLHDWSPLDPQAPADGPGDSGLTDREAWLCLKSRLASPRPKGSRLIWVFGPLAACLAAALVVVWLRSPGASAPLVASAERAAPSDTRQEPLPAAVAPRPLESGSQLVSAESSIRVGLPDNSSALVEPRGALELVDLDPAHVVLRLVSGAVYMRVAPRHTGDLRVYAGEYAVVVHGTGFRVQSLGDQLRVQLRHGSVEVRSIAAGDAEPGRFLKPGEELTLDASAAAPLRTARLKPISRGEMDLLAAEEGDTLAMKASDEPAAPEARSHRIASRAPHYGPEAAENGPQNPGSGVAEAAANVPTLQADIARCRARLDPGAAGETGAAAGSTLRLDLTVSETGQVLAAAAERSAVDPRLSGCLAEAALDWHLDAPPEALRGLQFVFPIKL
jgi:hypothetical protein